MSVVPCLLTHPADLSVLSDADLVTEVARRAAAERQATAAMIRILIEFDRRRLYLGEGYSSLFAYCTHVLHYSEHAAFNRIEVARAAARWPQLLECLEDGSLHLAGARLLAPHLTEENLEDALAEARYRSKREIEEVAAGLAHRNLLVGLDAQQFRLHVTISRETRNRLFEVQALLRTQLPKVGPDIIFEQALAVLLEKLKGRRRRATTPPRPRRQSKTKPQRRSRSRHVPAAVARDVRTRDEERCAFVGRQGRCPERDRLQLHHVKPFAAGGESTVANIELRCPAHNGYEAEQYFGPEVVAAARARAAARCGVRSGGPPVLTDGPMASPPRDEFASPGGQGSARLRVAPDLKVSASDETP